MEGATERTTDPIDGAKDGLSDGTKVGITVGSIEGGTVDSSAGESLSPLSIVVLLGPGKLD